MLEEFKRSYDHHNANQQARHGFYETIFRNSKARQ